MNEVKEFVSITKGPSTIEISQEYLDIVIDAVNEYKQSINEGSKYKKANRILKELQK